MLIIYAKSYLDSYIHQELVGSFLDPPCCSRVPQKDQSEIDAYFFKNFWALDVHRIDECYSFPQERPVSVL